MSLTVLEVSSDRLFRGVMVGSFMFLYVSGEVGKTVPLHLKTTFNRMVQI